MSLIYKVNHIVNNETIKIFAFIGDNNFTLQSNLSDIFTQEEIQNITQNNVEVVLINTFIYPDDTIDVVKKKIIFNTDIRISTAEIYLFCLKNKLLKPSIVYNQLTQNEIRELSKELICDFLLNIVNDNNDNVCSSVFDSKQESFDFNDFTNNFDIEWDNSLIITEPIGINLSYKNKVLFVANPFNLIQFDPFIKKQLSNILTTQNKFLLFEFGDLLDNNIYFTSCKDVLQNTTFNDIDIISLYFPLLIQKDINSLQTLNDLGDELFTREKQENFEKFNDYNNSIQLFHSIHNNKKKELNFLKNTPGIIDLFMTIHPIYNIKLPLDVVFKFINSNKEIPMIKFNPGKLNENMYRFFTDNNISTQGKKVPYLYTKYANKKNRIMKLSRIMARTKQVSFYIEIPMPNHTQLFFCNFESNGNIIIKSTFNQPMQVKEIENLIINYINEPIIKKIKIFLEKSGYSYIEFNSFLDNNIEINKLTLAYALEVKKKINFNLLKGCFASVFNIIENKSVDGVNEIQLIYKRVSNYDMLDSQTSFINELRKQGKEAVEIVEELMNNFKISQKKAEKKFLDWSGEVSTMQNAFANKKITIITNTGFPILIRKNKSNSITSITIESINDLRYIPFINIFVDTIMRLVVDKKSTSITSKTIKGICKKQNTYEVQKADEIVTHIEDEDDTGITFDDDDDDDDDALFDLMDDGDSDDELFDEEGNDLFDDSGEGLDFGELTFMGEQTESKGETKEKQEITSDNEEDEDLNEIIDLENVVLMGSKNIFIQKKIKLEPRLFLRNQQGRFKAYSKACSSSKAKQPIMLTAEEKKYIDDKDKAYGIKSYDEFLTYGSGSEKFHYICPRFWCMADENGKSRSITLKEINEGKCGGWDALIPFGARKVPKGKKILEFTDTRWHKENVDTDNKLVYKPMYPGYQDPKKHPEGLCVPCCFTKPVGYGNSGWKKLPNKEGWVNNITGEKTEKEPKILLDYMYKPEGNSKQGIGPDYKEDKNGNIILETIVGKKQKREKPSKSQQDKFGKCDQTPKKQDIDDDIENDVDDAYDGVKKGKTNKKADYSPLDGDESFPLDEGQLGYLPSPVVFFLQYEQQIEVLRRIGKTMVINKKNGTEPPTNFKTGILSKFSNGGTTPISYLLRKGMQRKETQSFLCCIADAFNHIEKITGNSKTKISKTSDMSLTEFKNKLIGNLTLTTFISLQSGNLVRLFSKNNFTETDITSYLSDPMYSKIDENNEEQLIFFTKAVSAFENFKNYLLDDNITIDYEFLWDYISMPKNKGGLFSHGLNLFILNSPDDDITQKIEIICPTTYFSTEYFSKNKPVLILYSKNNYYEPIYSYKRVSRDFFKIKKTFNLLEISDELPEVAVILNNVNNMLIHECKPLPSLPDRYNFVENKQLTEVIEVMSKIKKYKFLKNVVNFNYKTIGILIEKKKTNNIYYLPVGATKIKIDTPFIFANDSSYYSSFEGTYNFLKEIKKLSKGEIVSEPKMKIINQGMIVGIVTETNQFVPTIPEIFDETNNSPMFSQLETLNDNYNTFQDDKNIIIRNNIDDERIIIIMKIKLESNFYYVFRNTLRMVLDNLKLKEKKIQLIEICNDLSITYYEKINLTIELLKEILDDFIEFVEYNVNDFESIKKVTSCLGLLENKCDKLRNCTFSKTEGLCKLLLPKYNLVTDNDNEVIYFKKLADELIRKKLIRNYLLKSNIYLNLKKMNYNVRENEMIILEEILYNEFFENLNLKKTNTYISNYNTYDISKPSISEDYTDLYESEQLYKIKQDVLQDILSHKKEDKITSKDIVLESQPQGELKSLPESKNKMLDDVTDTINTYTKSRKTNKYRQINKCIVKDTDNKLSLNYWYNTFSIPRRKINRKKSGFKKQGEVTVLRFQNNNNCSWEIAVEVINTHLESQERIITKVDVKTLLIEIYKKLMPKYENHIKGIFKLENKLSALKKLINKESLNNIFKIDNYYLTAIDYYLLFNNFNINFVMIAAGGNLLISQSKVKEKDNIHEETHRNPLARPQKVFSSVNNESRNCFIICVRKVKGDNSPIYGLLEYSPENTIEISLDFIKERKLLEEFLENNIQSKENLFELATAKKVRKKRKKPASMNIKVASGGYKTKKLGKMRLF